MALLHHSNPPALQVAPIAPVKIVAIANQKGGVGKTTTAVNLGSALAEQGRSILIVDLDPQANATSAFGMQDLEGESLYEPLLSRAQIVEKVFPTRLEGLFLIPADLDLAGAELEIVKIVRIVEQVRDSGANDRLEIGGILMTMFDSRTKLSAQVVSEVRQHFGVRVYETVIPRSVRLSEAPSFGKTILEYNSSGKGARAYRALAQEFLKRQNSATTAHE